MRHFQIARPGADGAREGRAFGTGAELTDGGRLTVVQGGKPTEPAARDGALSAAPNRRAAHRRRLTAGGGYS